MPPPPLPGSARHFLAFAHQAAVDQFPCDAGDGGIGQPDAPGDLSAGKPGGENDLAQHERLIVIPEGGDASSGEARFHNPE